MFSERKIEDVGSDENECLRGGLKDESANQ